MSYRMFLYPGQGSQKIGMGASLIAAYPEASAIFESASDYAGYDIAKLCSDGPIEKLSQTLYTQPALFTVEAALTDVLKARGVKPDAVAGHSLGEFGAWYAADVYSFEEGFKLVAERGRLMDSADPDGIGTMAAVIGLTSDVVIDVCNGIDGRVVVANDNSPMQQVISGEKDAVEQAGALLSEKGAKRVIPLKVSGAFHSPLMEDARAQFAEAVGNTTINDGALPVYANVQAATVTDADDIRRCMVEQLTGTVRWTETVQAVIGDAEKSGGAELYEIGPGAVLAGLIKRIDKSLAVRSVSDADGIEEAI